MNWIRVGKEFVNLEFVVHVTLERDVPATGPAGVGGAPNRVTFSFKNGKELLIRLLDPVEYDYVEADLIRKMQEDK